MDDFAVLHRLRLKKVRYIAKLSGKYSKVRYIAKLEIFIYTILKLIHVLCSCTYNMKD